MFGRFCLNATAVTAIKGHRMALEFKQSMKEKDSGVGIGKEVSS